VGTPCTAFTWHIYGLADPETSLIHYVGQSRRVLGRYRDHVNLGALRHFPSLRPKARDLWIQDLQNQGQQPELVILDSVTAKEACASGLVPLSVYELEVAWIDRLLAAGHPVTNGPDRRHDKIRRERHEVDLLEAAAERGRKLARALDIEPRELLED